jgi:hypothetical protein
MSFGFYFDLVKLFSRDGRLDSFQSDFHTFEVRLQYFFNFTNIAELLNDIDASLVFTRGAITSSESR